MMQPIPRYREEAGPQRLGLVLALVLHTAIVAVILNHPPTRAATATVAPIMVSLIQSPPLVKPQTPTPRKPRPVRLPMKPTPSHPVAPPPLVAAPAATAAPYDAPASPVQDLPPIEAAPRQSVATAPSAATVPTTAAPTVAFPPLVLPRFDAAYLQNPPPAYPSLARRLGEQGRVLLRVLVTPEGMAERVELKTSSGAQRLDQAALDAVKSWRFVPARQGDQSVSAWVVVPISFSLEG